MIILLFIIKFILLLRVLRITPIYFQYYVFLWILRVLPDILKFHCHFNETRIILVKFETNLELHMHKVFIASIRFADIAKVSEHCINNSRYLVSLCLTLIYIFEIKYHSCHIIITSCMFVINVLQLQRTTIVLRSRARILN